MKSVSSGRRAFTLIELLIVIAIIAILALIAVPNFLEAQTRAKVSRTYSDLRALATAIEAYSVDYGVYPWCDDPAAGYPGTYSPIGYRLLSLTTPVAYITSVYMPDPFVETGAEGAYGDGFLRNQYNYRNHQFWGSATDPLYRQPVWVLNSLGPDRVKSQGLKAEAWARGLDKSPLAQQCVIYDPTNGTTSYGDIPRTGGETVYRQWK